jgi:predicted nucleotidyltransferase
MMDEQLEFLRLLAQRLDSAGIPYMLTGSPAMAVYAQPRMTRDIDLVIECRTEDAENLVRLLEPDCYLDAEAVRRAVELRSMFHAIHRELIIKADFIVKKAEPYRVLEFERRRRLDVDGLAVWVVSIEDLILSKLSWAKGSHSPQQQSDVQALLRSSQTVDFEYLNQWSGALGVHATLQSLRST